MYISMKVVCTRMSLYNLTNFSINLKSTFNYKMSSERVQVNMFKGSNWVRYTIFKIKASSSKLSAGKLIKCSFLQKWHKLHLLEQERSYLLSCPGLKLNASVHQVIWYLDSCWSPVLWSVFTRKKQWHPIGRHLRCTSPSIQPLLCSVCSVHLMKHFMVIYGYLTS